MKRFCLLLFCMFALSLWAFAQEAEHAAAPAAEGAHAAEQHSGGEGEHEEGDKYIVWKWANFAILAVVLGYMLGKALPPFFQSRTAGIQKSLVEAAAAKAQAEQRVSEITRRLESLQTEVDRIRSEAHAEMAREGDRIRQETDSYMARIQSQAEQEIAAITKHATQLLKTEGANLAIQLADQRIRSRITGDTQSMLVDRFVRQLDAGQGARN